jgi:hypothetical protein
MNQLQRRLLMPAVRYRFDLRRCMARGRPNRQPQSDRDRRKFFCCADKRMAELFCCGTSGCDYE